MRATALVATLLVLLPAVVALADEPVATVGGHAISRSELEKHVRAQLIEIDNKRYEALKKGLDELVSEQLLKQEAEAQKTTVEDLFSTNVTSKLKDMGGASYAYIARSGTRTVPPPAKSAWTNPATRR